MAAIRSASRSSIKSSAEVGSPSNTPCIIEHCVDNLTGVGPSLPEGGRSRPRAHGSSAATIRRPPGSRRQHGWHLGGARVVLSRSSNVDEHRATKSTHSH
ncbi:unnamed protein product [Prorocentrum cordatum]|nr:unnamed protein product [Polarella glacialis]